MSFDDHHFVAAMREQRAIDDLADIHLISAGQKPQRFFGSLRRTHQTFAAGVLADPGQDFLHHRGDGLLAFHPRRLHFENCFVQFHSSNSKELFRVSHTRTRSSTGPLPEPALEKASVQWACSRRSIANAMFSVVGTRVGKIGHILVQIFVREVVKHAGFN